MRDWDADLSELDRSTAQLLATIDALSSDDLTRPSLLPGWTRGHVVAHIDGNARGLRNVAAWAADGVERPMYSSREARNADIELNLSRTPEEHRAAVAASAADLRRVLGLQPESARDRTVVLGSGVAKPGGELPLHRLQEVCVHHADLGLAYTYRDWPLLMCIGMIGNVTADFTARGQCPVDWVEVDSGERFDILPGGGPGLRGPATALLAWLIGRTFDPSELTAVGMDQVPESPTWR